MGWQARHDSWPGEEPRRDDGLPGPAQDEGLPAGFERGGPWAATAPSAALALALEAAAGPEDGYDGADTDALIGIARQWAAIESWAAAGQLAALRAVMREDSQGGRCCAAVPGCPRGGTIPSTTRSRARWRWGRCPRRTSRAWRTRWACGWRASAGCSLTAR